MTKAILFDLDDTLYARQDPFCRAFRTAFGPGGELFPVLPASLAAEAKAGTGLWAESDDGPLSAVYRSFLRHGYDVFEDGMTGRITMEQMYIARIKRTTEELGFTLTDEQGLAFQAQYVYALEHLQTGPVIAAMLDYCVEKGCFLGLITNGKSGHQRMKYHAMELSRWIPEDHVLASGDVGINKPDPDIMRVAESRWNLVPEETWYVGDHYDHDILCAARVGWHTLWLRRNGGAEPDADGADVTVSTEQEMFEAVKKILCD